MFQQQLKQVSRRYIFSILSASLNNPLKEETRVRGGESQNSSVGIETGYGNDGRGFIPGKDKIFFSSP
jgi:hypothetical protein